MKVLIGHTERDFEKWFDLPINHKVLELAFNDKQAKDNIILKAYDLCLLDKIKGKVDLKFLNNFSKEVKFRNLHLPYLDAYRVAYDDYSKERILQGIRVLSYGHFKIYPMCYTINDLGESIAYGEGLIDSEQDKQIDFEMIGKDKLIQSKMVQIEDVFIEFY